MSLRVQPNAGHVALKMLADKLKDVEVERKSRLDEVLLEQIGQGKERPDGGMGGFRVLTQNVDG